MSSKRVKRDQSEFRLSSEMKFILVLIEFMIICKVRALTREFGSDGLFKAFANISEVLAKQNHLITVVVDSASSDALDFVFFKATAGFPHVVSMFRKERWFRLKSSAIVLLASIKTLDMFNNSTILPSTFSMRQQLIIYSSDGTFDELARMGQRKLSPINQYEYFVIEKEKSIRLLTFNWYLIKKCNVTQLVEVNKFD